MIGIYIEIGGQKIPVTQLELMQLQKEIGDYFDPPVEDEIDLDVDEDEELDDFEE